jgi:hypothetical protein
MSHVELLENYLNGIALLRNAVAGLSPSQWLARPIPEKWSTLEVVAHLSDFEPIYADRIKRIVAFDRPLLMAAGEKPFAQSLAYQERDPNSEIELIALTRRQLARILCSLPADIFGRQGVHSELGLVTITQILGLAARHIEHHVPFIIEKKKALGLAN